MCMLGRGFGICRICRIRLLLVLLDLGFMGMRLRLSLLLGVLSRIDTRFEIFVVSEPEKH